MTTTNHPVDGRPDGGTTHRTTSPTETMEAITQHRYGTAETLTLATVERPTPGPRQVLIEVEAAGVDRGTCHLMTGTPYLVRLVGYGLTRPKQPIVGLDVAGRVVAVGSEVERFDVGDEVFGIAEGSLATYAVAKEEKVARKPADATWEQAAVAAVSGITALQALVDTGRIEPGQRVLVVGASGGVGSYGVQLAKALGAEVTGVASAAKLDLVRSLGADHVIDYATEGLDAAGADYDLIIDIGGRNPISVLRSVLAVDGTLVMVGGEDGGRLTGGMGRTVGAMIRSLFTRQRLTAFISTEHHSFMETLAAHIESGAVVPAVGARYPLADAPAAIAELDAGRARGKTVILVGGVSRSGT
ncbi:MAG: NAD(P)-dependent alcohol dehydrogenase [Actinomycetota bacterium]